MGNYKFKFSIIIPVYNVEDYLEETLLSVINQSIGFINNIQIILVNDGSPDSSDLICKEYANKYPNNIKYIEKPNGGVSSARNTGIPYIEGKYVNFLDSDDKWDKHAFKHIYKFFEKHYDEIDLCATKIMQFEASTAPHILNYKFKRGTRVADLRSPEDCKCIHMHASSSFIKSEVVKESGGFNEMVKFGEDSLFVNKIILRTTKLGVVEEAVYNYRIRANENSAIQGQRNKVEFYTTSPEIHYKSLIEESLKRYGLVIYYIQSLIAYDIGWRVGSQPPEEILENTELMEKYIAILKNALSFVKDKVYLRSPFHARMAIKNAIFTLKHDKPLYPLLKFNRSERTVDYKKKPVINFNFNQFNLIIHLFNISGNILTVEGIVSKWLLKIHGNAEKTVVLRIGKNKFPLELSEYEFIKDSHFFSNTDKRYYRFKQEIDIKDLIKSGKGSLLRFSVLVNGKTFNCTNQYGKFIPRQIQFTAAYKAYGNYFVRFTENGVRIKKSKVPALTHLWFETKALLKLLIMGKFNAVFTRIGCFFYKKFVLRNKKLWLISDRYERGGDNGEAMFKFLNQSETVDKNIKPVFVVSCKNEEETLRLQKIGKVIHWESKLYPIYFLCSDKILCATASEYAFILPQSKNAPFLHDLRNFDFIFLQHGIIYNDLTAWLQKFNKNIAKFVTSALPEYNSIKNDGYLYTDEVVLTGLPRYDYLENKPQKQILILPTWRKNIKESYDALSQSVYFDGFKDTEFFKFYNSLINDEHLLEVMKKKGYTGLFCLHPIQAEQWVDFQGNDIFKINQGAINYAEIFSKSSLMVTDYSSVFFDFAYLRKPLVYAQFDKEDFYGGQIYDQGYFTHEKDGFGPVCYDLNKCVEEIIKIIENDCQMEDKYLERVNSFYAFNDRKNCERVYNSIIEEN